MWSWAATGKSQRILKDEYRAGIVLASPGWVVVVSLGTGRERDPEAMTVTQEVFCAAIRWELRVKQTKSKPNTFEIRDESLRISRLCSVWKGADSRVKTMNIASSSFSEGLRLLQAARTLGFILLCLCHAGCWGPGTTGSALFREIPQSCVCWKLATRSKCPRAF